MTGPPVLQPAPPYSFNPSDYGTGGNIAQQQLTAFNAARDATLQGILQQRGVIQQPVQTPAMAQQGPPVSTDWRDDDLLGAAKFWGIPQEVATQMPRDQLVGLLNGLRTEARPKESSLINAMGAVGAFGAGAGEALINLMHSAPGLSQTIGTLKMVHDAHVYFGSLAEGVRASTPESIQPILKGEAFVGNLAALSFPAEAAWNLVGVVGKAVPFLNKAAPMVRMAAQGAGSAYLLSGSDESFQEHPGLSLGVGAVLGGAIGVIAPNAPPTSVWSAMRQSVSWQRAAPIIEAAQTKVGAAFIPEGIPTGISVEHMAEAGMPGVGLAAEDASAGLQGQASALPSDFLPDVARARAGPRAMTSAPGPTQPPLAGYQPTELGASPGVGTPPPTGFESFASGEPPIALSQAPLPHGFEINDASMLAAGLNKTGIVMESPELPAIIKQTQITEATAGDAATASNPGGTNLIQGIADPAGFMQNLGKVPGSEFQPYVQFAKRVGTQRLDALISDTPITKAMVKQYETLGVYEGQQVTTRSGMTGTIQSINGTRAVMKLANTDAAFEAEVGNLSPSVQSPGMIESPPLWEEFQNFATGKAIPLANEMSGRIVPEQLQSIIQANLPQYMEEFLQQAGITDKGQAARVRQYFNKQFVEGFKLLAPTESLAGEAAVAEAQKVADAPNATSHLGTLDEHAQVKGFTVTPLPGGGAELTDVAMPPVETQPLVPPGAPQAPPAPPTSMRFNSFDAAHEYLEMHARELPDITPPTTVPVDLVAMHPQAPLQAPNTNEAAVAGLPEAIGHLEEATTTPETQAALRAQYDALKAQGRVGELQNKFTQVLSNWDPMRRLMANIDESLHSFGLESGVFQGFNAVNTGLALRQNFMQPLQDAAWTALQDVRTATKRSGLWGQMYAMGDVPERAVQAAAHGMTAEEIASFDKAKIVWQRMFPETGLAAERELTDYLPMLQKAQSTGDWAALERYQGSSQFTAFMKEVRTGVVNARELDPDVLFSSYIRTLGWSNFVDAPYQEFVQHLGEISTQVPELGAAVAPVKNWLEVIKNGYTPEADLIRDATLAVARRVIGPQVTVQDAQRLALGGLNSTYAALMGFRVDVAVRDSQRIWLALPRAGSRLITTMTKYLGSGAVRDEMWQRAAEDGIVQLQTGNTTSPGIMQSFEQQAFDPALAGGTTARAQALGRVSAAVDDLLPNALRSDKVKPGYLYSRQNEIVRMLVGTTGRDMATDALAEYRAAGPLGDLQKLLQDTKMTTYYPAVGREFQRMVALGDDVGAARFAGQQLADATNLTMGAAAGPINSRSVTGKIGMMLGNYPLFYLNYLREALGNGEAIDKVKTAALIGGVSAALYSASKKTGWNLMRLNPTTGFAWGGGPVLETGGNVLKAVAENVGQIMGKDNPGAQPPPSIMSTLGTAAQMFNPLAGIARTAEGVDQAFQGPNPGQDIARLLTTGERGPTEMEIGQRFGLPQTDPGFQQQVQPQANPVSAGRAGIPYVPQQLVTMPPGLGGPLVHFGDSGGVGSSTSIPPTGASSATGTAQQAHWDATALELHQRGIPAEVVQQILGPRPTQ